MSDPDFRPLSPVAKLAWLARLCEDAGLSKAARLVALALATRHNSLTGRLDPGMADIARRAGLSRRGAQLARAELVRAGHLEATRRTAGDAHRSTAYRLAGAAPPGAAAAPRPGVATAPEHCGPEPLKKPAGDDGGLKGRLLAALARHRTLPLARAQLAGVSVLGVAGGVLRLEASGPGAAAYLSRDRGLAAAIAAAGIGRGDFTVAAPGTS